MCISCRGAPPLKAFRVTFACCGIPSALQAGRGYILPGGEPLFSISAVAAAALLILTALLTQCHSPLSF